MSPRACSCAEKARAEGAPWPRHPFDQRAGCRSGRRGEERPLAPPGGRWLGGRRLGGRRPHRWRCAPGWSAWRPLRRFPPVSRRRSFRSRRRRRGQKGRGAGGRVRGRGPRGRRGRRGVGAASAPAGRGAIGAAAPRRPDRNLITIQVRHDTVRVELGQRGDGREEATRPVERERDRSFVKTTLGDRRARSSRVVVRHQCECLAIEEIK